MLTKDVSPVVTFCRTIKVKLSWNCEITKALSNINNYCVYKLAMVIASSIDSDINYLYV